MRFGLSAKIVLVVVPLVFAPLAMLSWFSYQKLQTSEWTRANDVLVVAVTTLRANVRNNIESSKRNLQFFADSSTLRKYVGIEDERLRFGLAQPAFIDFLQQIRRAYPDYEEIRLILPDGFEDTRVAPPELPGLTDDESGTPLFEAMRNSANDDYVEVITQPDPDNIRLIQSRRVYALDPQPDPRIQNLKFKGYLVVSQNLRFLQGLVADLSRNLDGKLYVVDADGCIVAAHDEALLGQKVSAELRQKIERLMAGQPMPDGLAATILPNLYVVGDLPPSWLAVSASRLAESLFQTTGAAILLTSLLLSLLLRKIVVAPIKSLIAVTEEIGAERSMVDLKTARADEIGMLTQALDGMQTTLHERRQALLEQNQTLETRARDLGVANEAAQAASKAKSAFMATMSHEIRTPMNGVLGMTELLLGTPLETRQRRFATTVLQSGRNLLAIINDILDFSKIEEGKLALSMRPFKFGELCEEVIELFTRAAMGRGLGLVADIDAAAFASVYGDPDRLRQVLSNLLGNALKFTGHGEVTLRVLSVRDAAPSLEIEVIDSGVGIPADELSRVFEPFYQVDGSASRRHGGTGLGLAIVRQLVEAMGGRITVQSTVDEGSCFTVNLPFDCPPPVTPARTAMAVVATGSASQRLALRRALEGRGYRVEAVASGGDFDAALSLLKAAPQLVVLEREMLGAARRCFGHEPRYLLLKQRLDLGTTLNNFASDPRNILELPIRHQELVMVLSAFDSEAPKPKPALEISTPLPGSRRALVAEDNPVNQLVLVEMLRLFGVTSSTAATGVEAAALFEQSLRPESPLSFDVIFMDWHMPDMDGLKATLVMRTLEQAQPHRQRTPIIAVTASAMPGDRDACFAAGMDDYLAKPCALGELETLLDRWCPESRREDIHSTDL